MYWFIVYAIIFIIIFSKGSFLPNNPWGIVLWFLLTPWVIFQLAICYSFQPKQHLQRNKEELEWYLIKYKILWRLIYKNGVAFDDEYFRMWNIFTGSQGNKWHPYRLKKTMKVYADVRENYERNEKHWKLKDTLFETYRNLDIFRPDSKIYQPQYKGIVNDLKRLEEWEPTLKIEDIMNRQVIYGSCKRVLFNWRSYILHNSVSDIQK